MTKQVICANCGEPMQQSYTRTGLAVYICIHNTGKIIKTKNGMPKCVIVYCKTKAVNEAIIMRNKQIICVNCDEPMKQCYLRTGLKLYLCMHNTAKFILNRIGLPKHVLIYCRAEVFGLKKAFDNMTRDTDLTIEKLRNATENKIDDASLYKSVNLALQLEFATDTLPELFNASLWLGYSLGITPQKAIESLVVGIARKSRLVLDNIGIVFLAESAYKWYRAKHEIETATLTESQRHEAWKNYAIKSVIETAARLKTPMVITK
ncbi:MAG: hypothetical protein IBV52_08400 [Candidatus Bathyarchaeota archaeon]